ncbi:MAG: hypothetical protein IKV19_06115 [Bacteroidaceae bacterium]|nr:hypothetical protein [Bacteroidaceae bacterium]
MKSILEYITVLSLLLFVACTEDELQFSPCHDGGEIYTCSMSFNGTLSGYDNETRVGTAHEWCDGDRLYIRFATDKDTVLGFANYNSIKEEWQVSYAGALPEGVTHDCEVYYFENAVHKSNTCVELGALSAVYVDTVACYYFASSTISLSATLHPKTGRLRFVSPDYEEFSLTGIRYYIGFDLSNKEFDVNYRRRLVLNTKNVKDDGGYSTDYIYGFYEENYDGDVCKEVPIGLDVINHADTSKVYHKDFAVEMLNAGNSGYITLPSESVNKGWGVENFNGGRYFAKWKYRGPYSDDYDGVLLSGDKMWNHDSNDLYQWGFRDYDSYGEYYTGTGSISKTEYDWAYTSKQWRNGFMPTKNEVSKMLSLNRCFDCCLVSDDFNVLVFDRWGYNSDMDGWDLVDVGSAYLWTATAASSSMAYATVLSDEGYEIKSMHKKYGMGVFVTFDEELANNDNDIRDYNATNNGY